jgi:hypothetical protein
VWANTGWPTGRRNSDVLIGFFLDGYANTKRLSELLPQKGDSLRGLFT